MTPNPYEYIDMLKQARAEGHVISKEYAKLVEHEHSKLNQIAPNLWKAVMSHRYILPAHLQSEYISQQSCDALFLDFLISYSTGQLSEDDDVTHVSYINALRALQFGRPMFYIERSLAEALIRTDVPLDLRLDDIHWVYPQFKLFLPANLFSITRNGEANPAMFLDVCRVEKDQTYQMPAVLKQELSKIGGYYFPGHTCPVEAFLLNVCLHFDAPEGNINYAVTAPWEGATLSKTLEIGNTNALQSSMVNDELDHEFMARMTCFAVNVMLRLSSLPSEAQVAFAQDAKVIRKPKQEGKRTIVGLYRAKILGLDEVKPVKLSIKAEPTGKHLAAHWRRGHWRRQAYGPKSGLRRFQWIQPYHVGEAA